MSDLSNEGPKLRPGDPDYVGRGYPPEHGRIKPNEVRNPAGRRGKARAAAPDDFASQMRAAFAEPIVAKDGKVYNEAMLIRNGLVAGVLKHDTRSIKLLAELNDKYGLKSSLREDEADEVEAYRSQLIADALTRRQARDAFETQRLATSADSDGVPDGGNSEQE